MIFDLHPHHFHFTGESGSGFSLALLLSLLGLVFSGFNFWYVMERRGKLALYAPLSFSYAEIPPNQILIRLPLVFEATGAKPKVIRNLRLTLLDFPSTKPILWSSIRDTVQPIPGGRNDVPAVFAVSSRTAIQTFTEFQGEFQGYGSERIDLRVRVEGVVGKDDQWVRMLECSLPTKNITNPLQFLSYTVIDPVQRRENT